MNVWTKERSSSFLSSTACLFLNFNVVWVGCRSDLLRHAYASGTHKLVPVLARVAEENFSAYLELNALVIETTRSATAAHLFDDTSGYPPGFVVFHPVEWAGGLLSDLAVHVVGHGITGSTQSCVCKRSYQSGVASGCDPMTKVVRVIVRVRVNFSGRSGYVDWILFRWGIQEGWRISLRGDS